MLPGPLNLPRKAATYYTKAKGYRASLQSRGLVYSYALAVSEENASGGTIVTAPTCGACGVLPAVLYHMHTSHDMSEQRILRALATAGLVGNVVKQNASISGADVGCQGEVGVACAMASAAACQLFGGSPAQVEYAAEMGLEHHLGMTCDLSAAWFRYLASSEMPLPRLVPSMPTCMPPSRMDTTVCRLIEWWR